MKRPGPGSVAAGLAAVALGGLVWRRMIDPWQRQWGATTAEARSPLPGDERVAEPAEQTTRAITIDAPPEAVWRWIVQLGADRGGFYSYERLENLFGLDIHNSDRIVAEWQERAVGDLVLADAAGTGGWYVVEVVPGEALVLAVGDLEAGRPVRRDEALRWEFQWTFALRPAPDGRTRLLVRERVGFGSRLAETAMAPVGLVSFVMTQKMLRGIRRRAETGAARRAQH